MISDILHTCYVRNIGVAICSCEMISASVIAEYDKNVREYYTLDKVKRKVLTNFVDLRESGKELIGFHKTVTQQCYCLLRVQYS